VKEMNLYATKLHLKSTKYTNPHGLADKANHSTASEQAVLSVYAMKNQLIREIVGCKQYEGLTYYPLRKFLKKY
jgi:serine-type D-Ala-D-Ala carboxypeptidase (penicillin-binding protein 5/6)